MLTPGPALHATVIAIALAVALQSVELLALRRAMADDGIWAWSVLRRDFPGVPPALGSAVFGYRGTIAVLILRLVAAGLVLVAPLPCLAVMLVTTVLIAVRWRGSFNGGSDAMTTTVLLATTIAAAAGNDGPIAVGCLWYVAFIAINSYTIAGLAKLRSAAWRGGTALGAFVATSVYGATRFTVGRGWARALSWTVMGLECGFAVVLVDPTVCAVMVGLAFAFHVANAYVFGLNRFVFAWLATYPALLYCSAIGLPG